MGSNVEAVSQSHRGDALNVQERGQLPDQDQDGHGPQVAAQRSAVRRRAAGPPLAFVSGGL